MSRVSCFFSDSRCRGQVEASIYVYDTKFHLSK